MNTVKTAEQAEFVRVVDRLKARGLNQSDIARELHVTRSAVAMILAGGRNPRPATLVMLRDLETRLGAAKADAGPATPLQELVGRLEYLARNDRANFEVARRVIESLVPVSSGVAAGQKRLLKKAFASARPAAPK